MRYFSDRKLEEMRRIVNTEMEESSRTLYMTYLKRIEELDKKNDQDGSCHDELMRLISRFQHFFDNYVPHKGKVDANDEDADAFEYENYDYQPKETL